MKLIPEVTAVFRNQDYGQTIEGVKTARLARFADDGGSLTELGRFADGAHQVFAGFKIAQINYGTIEPGVIKAFHVHPRQRDVWFVPPEHRVLLVLVDVRDDSPTARKAVKVMLGAGSSMLVSIPQGVAHGLRNLGDGPASIIYMTDAHFSPDPATTEEGRLPWDMIGPEIWEPAKD